MMKPRHDGLGGPAGPPANARGRGPALSAGDRRPSLAVSGRRRGRDRRTGPDGPVRRRCRCPRVRSLGAPVREPAAKYERKLLDGLRYPLPVVAERAAQAIVALDRVELAPKLVKLLDEPDPSAPRERDESGEKVVMVLGEVVKLNHNRNCTVCHPLISERIAPTSVLLASVPSQDESLPTPCSCAGVLRRRQRREGGHCEPDVSPPGTSRCCSRSPTTVPGPICSVSTSSSAPGA